MESPQSIGEATGDGKVLAQLYHALHAKHLLKIDKDYIVSNGNIEIVDELTGRVAENRRWPDGLHAAVEAKENCLKECNGRILNSICLQHFLTYYPRISGMTATAQVAEEEFRNFYNLHIVVLPPNRPCCRKDFPLRGRYCFW
jgi:preprotein translocase subunit SecA